MHFHLDLEKCVTAYLPRQCWLRATFNASCIIRRSTILGMLDWNSSKPYRGVQPIFSIGDEEEQCAAGSSDVGHKTNKGIVCREGFMNAVSFTRALDRKLRALDSEQNHRVQIELFSS